MPAVRDPSILRRVGAVLFGSATARVIWGVAAVVVAVIAITGGWGRATPAEVARVDAGEPVDVGQVAIAATGWTVRSDIETSALEDIEGAAGWLVVAVDVTAATDATTTFPDNAIDLAPDDDLSSSEPPRVVLLPDGTVAPDLQPGLPVRLALLWPVSESPAGDSLDLDYIRSTLNDSEIDSGRVWRVAGPAGTTTIPRDDAIAETLIEDEEAW